MPPLPESQSSPQPSSPPQSQSPRNLPQPTPTPTPMPMRIAVIGSGASGLASARSFLKYHPNCKIDIYEKSSGIGGVWNFNDDKEDNKSQGNGKGEGNPMYANLRTNIPKEIMAFKELPWDHALPPDTGVNGVDDLRSYVSHGNVKAYLESFADFFKLRERIMFDTFVCNVASISLDDGLDEDDGLFEVTSSHASTSSSSSTTTTTATTKVYTNVCICTGHFALPFLPPTLKTTLHNFTGTAIHSVHYNTPQQTTTNSGGDGDGATNSDTNSDGGDTFMFINKRVLVVGGHASGGDIAREVRGVASVVYVSADWGVAFDYSKSKLKGEIEIEIENSSTGGDEEEENKHSGRTCKLVYVPRTKHIADDGSVIFECGVSLGAADVDAIIIATGYNYTYPFLPSALQPSLNTPGANLHKGIWLKPNTGISFIGMFWLVVPFSMFEFQADAVAYVAGMSESEKKRVFHDISIAEASVEARAEAEARVGKDGFYMGENQWAYNSSLVKITQSSKLNMNMNMNTPSSAVVTDDFLRTQKEIFDVSCIERASCGVGMDDGYRETRFVRDLVEFKWWKIVENERERE